MATQDQALYGAPRVTPIGPASIDVGGHDERRSRRTSVRALSMRSIAALGAITLVVVGALVWTSSRLARTIGELEVAHRSVALVNDLERSVLTFRRFSDRQLATGDPEWAVARDGARRDVERLLDLARRALGTTPSERAHIAALDEELGEYFDARERAGRTGQPLSVVLSQQPLLDGALARLGALTQHELAALRETERETRRVERAAELTAVLASAALVFVVVWISLAIRRSIGTPLVHLSRTMQRFRRGDLDARARPAGARELGDAADAFNQMADALVRQREGQLTFLAGVVHDIRNPLGAIKFGVHSLRTEQKPEIRDRTLLLVDRQVDRLARLVDDVLDATRIEAGRLELRRARCDLRCSIREVVELYAPTAPAHPIRVELPDTPILVDADSVRMEQVLGNLLSNAIKYSPGGGPIDVRATSTERHALLEVRDHGIGIAADAMGDVFAPFRRRAPEIAMGAGLGLSVARRIVDAHGGMIEVDSELGRGSTFRVRLPLADAVEAVAAKEG